MSNTAETDKHNNVIQLAISNGVGGTSHNESLDWECVQGLITNYRDIGVDSSVDKRVAGEAKKPGVLYLGGRLASYGGTLGKKDVLSRNIITLDYDAIPCRGTEDFLDAVNEAYEGIEVLAHSTARHTDLTPKFRLVFPVDGEVLPEIYPGAVDLLAGRLSGYALDPKSRGVSQRMFAGQHFTDVKPMWELFEGGWVTPGLFKDVKPNAPDPHKKKARGVSTAKSGSLADALAESAVGVAGSLERAAGYLAVLDPDMERDGWLRVCMGLHHCCAGSAEGLALFVGWSAGGVSRFTGVEDVETAWRSLDAGMGEGEAVTLGTVGRMAQEARRDEGVLAGGAANVRAVARDVEAIKERLGGMWEYVDEGVLRGIVNGTRGKNGGGFWFLIAKNLPGVTSTDFGAFCDDNFGALFDRGLFVERYDEALEGLQDRYQVDKSGAEDDEGRREVRDVYLADVAALAKDVDKAVKQAKGSVFGVVRRYVQGHKQVGDLECSVDMFADRVTARENHHGGTVVVSPFNGFEVGGGWTEEVVADYKAHFPEFDALLRFLAAARFADSRRNAYLWLHCESNWGKGLLTEKTGVLGSAGLGICCETSVKEVEAALEGKPVGLSHGDLIDAWLLTVDEFKTIRSEVKQLNDTLVAAPKNMLRFSAPLYAKVFTSAESVDALVGDAGVEAQFANRFSYIRGKGDINEREVFKRVGAPQYKAELRAYCCEVLNKAVEVYREMGVRGSQEAAAEELGRFHAAHKLSLAVDGGSLDETIEEEAAVLFKELQKIASGGGSADMELMKMATQFGVFGVVKGERGMVLTKVNHVVRRWINDRFSTSEVGKVSMKSGIVVESLTFLSGLTRSHWIKPSGEEKSKTVKGVWVSAVLPK